MTLSSVGGYAPNDLFYPLNDVQLSKRLTLIVLLPVNIIKTIWNVGTDDIIVRLIGRDQNEVFYSEQRAVF